ncbi:MAG: class I SAM-dependent methyltransferase [Thermoplasmata archaeon]|nr:class I SAM-dependent methyltransferase [Thermoplasmata archaeon]
MLEIGCAQGQNLTPFLQAGWAAYGIEPQPHLAIEASTNGVEILSSFLEDNDQSGHRYDIIILHHVLEHTLDPRTCLGAIRRLISPDGKIFIEIPLFDSLPVRIFGPKDGNLEFPIHLTFLSVRALKQLLSQEGFTITDSRLRNLPGTAYRTIGYRLTNASESGIIGRSLAVVLSAAVQTVLSGVGLVLRKGNAIAITASLPGVQPPTG